MPRLALPTCGFLPYIKCVQIMTHSRCNADCVFCPYSESTHAADPGFMSDAVWKLILANLQPFANGINDGKMVPYLMQEPLLDKSIFAKIDDIYRAFPRTLVEISTNGAALTDKTVDKLFAAFTNRRHELWVSHHGINAETLQHIMAIDFERAHHNLIQALKKSNGRFKIKIRGAGVSRDGKHTFFTRQQYLDYWAETFKANQINTKNVEVDAFAFHDRAATLHRTDRGANLLNMGTVRKLGPDQPEFYCSRVDEWLHFDHQGGIRLCCMDYHHEVKLPNIQDMSLLEYFQSAAYTQLVEWVSGRVQPPENFICQRCTSPGG